MDFKLEILFPFEEFSILAAQPAGLPVMHTGRRDTSTMLARTKGRAYEEVAASTTRTERKIMSKRERKQIIVFQEQETQLQ